MRNLYETAQAAEGYGPARTLPPDTHTMWLGELRAHLPAKDIRHILDLGCGTGRFTRNLRDTFACPVTGVEPSAAMLRQAESLADIVWKHGTGEAIPLDDQSIDLVWMSQVFHHFVEPQQVLVEIDRVLTPGGILAIRNGSLENNTEIVWLAHFPEAVAFDSTRMLHQQDLIAFVTQWGFRLHYFKTVYQYFAPSYAEYYTKISHRGLSALIAISDAAFHAGLQRFKAWVEAQPVETPVYEPVDLFIFQKDT